MDERFRTDVGGNELLIGVVSNAAANESAVVGFVVHDVLETNWRVLEMSVSRINEAAFGRDPEHQLGVRVSDAADLLAAP